MYMKYMLHVFLHEISQTSKRRASANIGFFLSQLNAHNAPDDLKFGNNENRFDIFYQLLFLNSNKNIIFLFMKKMMPLWKDDWINDHLPCQ